MPGAKRDWQGCSAHLETGARQRSRIDGDGLCSGRGQCEGFSGSGIETHVAERQRASAQCEFTRRPPGPGGVFHRRWRFLIQAEVSLSRHLCSSHATRAKYDEEEGKRGKKPPGVKADPIFGFFYLEVECDESGNDKAPLDNWPTDIFLLTYSGPRQIQAYIKEALRQRAAITNSTYLIGRSDRRP